MVAGGGELEEDICQVGLPQDTESGDITTFSARPNPPGSQASEPPRTKHRQHQKCKRFHPDNFRSNEELQLVQQQ